MGRGCVRRMNKAKGKSLSSRQIKKKKWKAKKKNGVEKVIKMAVDSGADEKTIRKNLRYRPGHSRSGKKGRKLTIRTKRLNGGTSGLVIEQRKLAKAIRKSKDKMTKKKSVSQAAGFVKYLKSIHKGDFASQAQECKKKRQELVNIRKLIKKQEIKRAKGMAVKALDLGKGTDITNELCQAMDEHINL